MLHEKKEKRHKGKDEKAEEERGKKTAKEGKVERRKKMYKKTGMEEEENRWGLRRGRKRSGINNEGKRRSECRK